jgi:hypothetical protein
MERMDIEDRKRTEDAIRTSEKSLRVIYDAPLHRLRAVI